MINVNSINLYYRLSDQGESRQNIRQCSPLWFCWFSNTVVHIVLALSNHYLNDDELDDNRFQYIQIARIQVTIIKFN